MIIASQDVLTVVLYSAGAALGSAAGVLPFAFARGPLPPSLFGMSYALAAGFMLGVGNLIMAEGLTLGALPVTLGAAIGVGYTYWTHRYSGTDELEVLPGHELPPTHGYKLVLLNALHAASEGVAIGAAMALDLRLGAFMAVTLAVHNVAESLALTSVLRLRKLSLGNAAGLNVITNVPQVLMAIVAFTLTRAVPGLLAWTLGFAAGTLLFLTLTELLPAAYRRANRRGIALLVSAAAGAVVLVRTLVV